MTTQTQRLDSSQLDLAGSDARERPPVLPTWSPLGHLGAFRSDPLGLLERARPLGDVVGVRIMHQNAFFLYDADAIQRVLVADHGRFSKSTRGYEALRLLLGNGLVTSEGSFWKRQRRIAQPAFHRRRIAALGQVMQTAATDLSRSWQGRDQLDVADEMMRVTLRIAGETLFSVDLSDEAGEVGAAVTGALEYFKALFMSALPVTSWLPLPSHIRGRRATRALDDLVYAIIAERRASDDSGQDLLGMLMDARDEETGEGMSDMQLRDEVLTMLMAGHETTANALSWTLYLLSQHPAVRSRVEAEIDRVLGGADAPEASHLGELSYTRQVLQEAMRLYPPVWAVARRAEEDVDLAGHAVPKGSIIVMSPYAVHRHPRYWHEPDVFDPERFSEANLARAKHERPKLAYFPFLAGPRKCIGDHFAQMESLILLATLLKRHRLSLVPGHPIELEPSVTLRPKHGIAMRVEPR